MAESDKHRVNCFHFEHEFSLSVKSVVGVYRDGGQRGYRKRTQSCTVYRPYTNRHDGSFNVRVTRSFLEKAFWTLVPDRSSDGRKAHKRDVRFANSKRKSDDVANIQHGPPTRLRRTVADDRGEILRLFPYAFGKHRATVVNERVRGR